MNIQVEELERSGFQLKDKVTYDALTPFVKVYLSKVNVAIISFIIINVILFAYLIFHIMLVVKGKVNGLEYTLAFSGGVLIVVALIPIHELIHAIAYKLCGAQKISFTINLKSFVFLTVADRFVASRKEFIGIALAPFLIITSVLIAGYFFSGPYLKCSFVTALMCHTFLCSGDFGLTSYFLFHKHEELVTYDDSQQKASYFLVREK